MEITAELISTQKVFLVDTWDGSEAVLDPAIPWPGEAFSASWPTIKAKRIRTQEFDLNKTKVIIYFDNLVHGPTEAHQAGDVDKRWEHEMRTETVLRSRQNYKVPADKEDAYELEDLEEVDELNIGGDSEGTDVLRPHATRVINVWTDEEPDEEEVGSLMGKINNAAFENRKRWQWLCIRAVVIQETLGHLDKGPLWRKEYAFELDDSDSGWQCEWKPYAVVEDSETGKEVRDYEGQPLLVSVTYVEADFSVIEGRG